MKKILSLFMCLGALCASGKDYVITQASSERLTTIFSDGTLHPGDKVILKDGIYDSLGEFDLTAEGTPADSIALIAEHPGRAVFSGPLRMRVSGKYLHIEGLKFQKAWADGSCMIEFQRSPGKYASHCRFTSCVIDDCNNPDKSEHPVEDKKYSQISEYWLGLHGDNIRIDHCYFANKRVGGLMLQIWLSKDDHLNNHEIDHNLFAHRPNYGGNGAETIRIGNSWSSQLESRTLIEKNIFLHCDGENEIISVKSGHNILRNNLFFESVGGLVCRHGHYNVIESNTFIGNGKRASCGIRLINQGHTVYDNYCARLGDFGLLVRMGVHERPTAETDITKEPLTSFHRAENINVAGNTFVDCNTIDLGSGYGDKTPRNIKIAYNYFGNEVNNIKLHKPEVTLSGFRFLDNRYQIGRAHV